MAQKHDFLDDPKYLTEVADATHKAARKEYKTLKEKQAGVKDAVREVFAKWKEREEAKAEKAKEPTKAKATKTAPVVADAPTVGPAPAESLAPFRAAPIIDVPVIDSP